MPSIEAGCRKDTTGAHEGAPVAREERYYVHGEEMEFAANPTWPAPLRDRPREVLL
jgi:hypothetical protein